MAETSAEREESQDVVLTHQKKHSYHINWRLAVIGVLTVSVTVLAWFLFKGRFFAKSPVVPVVRESASVTTFRPILEFDFSTPGALRTWKSYALTNKSKYEISRDETGRPVLRATSQGTSSAIFTVVNVSAEARPFLSWEWKVAKFPVGRKNKVFGESSDSDYAARVTAVFGKHNPLATEMIQYVWDDHFPEGTSGTSSFSKNTKIVVVRSGPAKSGDGWILERRDLVRDYETLFGKPLKNNLRGISIMTDSDDTKSQTEAYVRSIVVSQDLSTVASQSLSTNRAEQLRQKVKKFYHLPFFRKNSV